MFKNTNRMTGREKELILKAWIRFVKSGCRYKDLSGTLRKYLSDHCSFMRTYSRSVFHQNYFDNYKNKCKFLNQFDRTKKCLSAEKGTLDWLTDSDYGDLNNAMINAVAPYLETLYERDEETEERGI